MIPRRLKPDVFLITSYELKLVPFKTRAFRLESRALIQNRSFSAACKVVPSQSTRSSAMVKRSPDIKHVCRDTIVEARQPCNEYVRYAHRLLVWYLVCC